MRFKAAKQQHAHREYGLGVTERASAQLTLQDASSVTHSLCGGRISGKQSQRGSLIRSQPNSAGSSLYRLPGGRQSPNDWS